MSRNADKQTAALLEALKRRPMTALEILADLGIARASARVYDLRQDGWDVQTEMITVNNRHGDPCRVARYALASRQCSLVPIIERGLHVKHAETRAAA